MRKQKTVTIDGTEFLLTQFPTTLGMKYKKKLGKVILPIVAEWMNTQEDEFIFPKLLMKLWENLDALDEQFIKELVVNGCTVGSMAFTDSSFDSEFAGEYGKLFKLLREIVEFNFSSGFTMLVSGGGEAE